ncbi:hypothetical protein LEP1GSC049_1415 [Leptospira kirschneri serovar Cynopteri str. 3522 CT]|nr:hypothetical protein LEP1GSC049_1415 [Leptospira kirschneri serovar Cynopteri str. 3522 CT]
MVKLNHSQILVNLFHSEEFLKCVKKERVQRLYLKKKKRPTRILGFDPK